MLDEIVRAHRNVLEQSVSKLLELTKVNVSSFGELTVRTDIIEIE